jgi:hypothetical protein
MDRVNPVHGWHYLINSNNDEGLTMARLSYRTWFINCKPLKNEARDWQLELEKGKTIHTFTISNKLKLIDVEYFAYKKIDEYIAEEIKS